MKNIKITTPIYATLIILVIVLRLPVEELNPSKIFSSSGWQKRPDTVIAASIGNLKGLSYSKEINGTTIYASFVPGKSIVWFGKNNDRCVILNDKLTWISWRQPTHLMFNDWSLNVETTSDLPDSIKSAEVGLIKAPRDFTKIRQYKGAFGLTKSIEGVTQDLTFGMSRVIKSFRFKGENLELTLSGSPTDAAVIELAPNLDYISSSVAGKIIDHTTVEVREIRTESEYRRHINKKYNSDIYPSVEVNSNPIIGKNMTTPPSEKKPESAREAPVKGEAKIPENPQPLVTQDSMSDLSEYASSIKADVAKEQAGDYRSWIIAALALISLSFVWIFMKRK